MKARLYMFLFAILPRRWQRKLWNRLADEHGYQGTVFGNGTVFCGTPQHDDHLYQELAEKLGKTKIR